jgi:hypothetical protein
MQDPAILNSKSYLRVSETSVMEWSKSIDAGNARENASAGKVRRSVDEHPGVY